MSGPTPEYSIPPPAVDIPKAPDAGTVDESHYLENQRIEAELEDFRQNTKSRKAFAWGLFVVVCVWLAAVLIIVFLQGFEGTVCARFKLETAVLVTLLTTTTLNVFGLFAIVTRYLFPKPK